MNNFDIDENMNNVLYEFFYKKGLIFFFIDYVFKKNYLYKLYMFKKVNYFCFVILL